MKLPNSVHLALLAATSLLTPTAFAASGPKPPPPPPPPQPSSGTLVFNYPNSANWGLAAHPSGAICAVGIKYESDTDAWPQMVWASGDLGATWSLLDVYAPPIVGVDYNDDLGGSITADAAGNIYTTGRDAGWLNNQPNHWYVRRSIDGGTSWTTVDDFAMKAPVLGGGAEMGIAVDAAGDVYTSACDVYYLNSVWYYDWTIRKGIGGTSFSTISVLSNSYPKDIFVHPNAGIFAVGYTRVTQKGSNSSVWLVRRSTDAGASWSTVDTFQLASGYGSVAMGVSANSTGIYVVGSASAVNKGTTSSHWIVRKSTDGGNSWTTVDNYQLISDSATQARCIAADPVGNLFVAGSSAGKWLLRKSAGGTGPWTTVDVFQNGTAATSPNAIAADAFGTVFVGGTDGANWLIKKY